MQSNAPGPFIRSAFAPAVLVVSNQDVDEICKKNGPDFSFCSILEACGTTVPASREPVKVKVNGDNQSAASIVVKSVDLKFLAVTNFGASRPKFQFLLLPPQKVEQFPTVKDSATVSAFQSQYSTISETFNRESQLTPWFDEYRTKFFKSLGPSAFEQFEHPIAAIVATTSQDLNPVDSLQRLFDRRATNIQNGLPRYVDLSVVVYHYVLVHDANGSVPIADAMKRYALVEKTWPGQTTMVTLNSNKEALENEDFQIWRSDSALKSASSGLSSSQLPLPIPSSPSSSSAGDYSTSVPGSPLGSAIKGPSSLSLPADAPKKGFYSRKVLISSSDMDSCKRLVRSLVWSWIIPHLEKTVQTIYPEVTKERSGLMHKFNLMWGSKFSRKNDENDPDGVLFEAASLEFRERRLADWAFMLGDFTVAYRTYMSLAEIYKNEAPTAPVALVYRASALEMAANCLCLLASNNASLATPQQWAEIDRHFVEAWDLYQRGRRRTWARRSALSHAYWAQWRLQASGSSAWERLVNDSTDPLELALLHQQRAFSYLLRSPARIRNYAFDLVKAADAFTTGHQFLHAVTCYFAAHQVYSMQTWSAVSDYLHFRIARLANVVERPDLAMQFITALLTENGQTAPIQNSSLREYLHIFRTYNSHLPFKLSAAHSINNAQATLPALSSLPVAPVPLLHRRVKLHVLDVPGGSSNVISEWSALESSIIEVMTPPDKRYLLTLRKPSTKIEHLGVVGEFIYVDVELTNPLKVPLQFTDMRLACHLTPSYSAMASGLSRRGSLSKADRPLAPAPAPASDEPVVDQPELWEAEKNDKLFGPGETRTVQFAVKPLVEGSLSIVGVIFKLCGVLEAFRPLAKPSVIKVSVPMPRVSLSLLGLPAASDSTRSALYVGQHHEVCLRIKNLGQKPLHNLAFTSSQPHLFLSDAMKEDLSLPHKWAARIPLAAPLQQDQTIDVPIVLRPTAEGTHSVQILVYYEPSHTSGPPSDIKHRLTRATFTLRVVKSIRCHATIRPDPLQIDRYLLALDVDNQTKLKTKSGVVIAIRDLRITSPNWRPVLLDAATGEPYVDVTKRIISQSPVAASSSDDSPGSRPLTPLSESDSSAPSPARTPVPLSKMSLHATTGASSYEGSSCMRPEILETTFGGAHLLPTVLPPRHATTLLFRLERKLPGDEDYDVANATMMLSPASAARAPDQLAARFLSQESIITRRNQAPKRSALFDNRTPEELAEAKRVHDTNVANEISLFVSWAVANDINSTSSASLSALTLTLPSNHPGSSPKSTPKSGHARPTTNFFASVNAFDIPFVPQAPWAGHSAQAAAPSSPSGAAESIPSDPPETESRSLTAQVGLHYCAPVHISLEYPSVVRHAFSRGPAFIPVVLHIFNTSAFSPLQLTFEALKPSEYASIPRGGVSGAPPTIHSTPWKSAQQSNTKRRPAIPAEEGRSHYLWMGRTTHSVAQLDVESPTSFALQACFPLPGAYNLNRWRVWVAPVAFPSRKVAVYASHQHFTTIVDDPSAPTTSVEWGASSRLGNSSLHQSLLHSKFARFSGSLLEESTTDALNSSYALTESHNGFLDAAPLEPSTASISAATISESPPIFEPSSIAVPSIDEAHEADISTEQTEESLGPTDVSLAPAEVSLADSTPTDLSAAVFHIDDSYADLGASYASPLPTNDALETLPESVSPDSTLPLNTESEESPQAP